MIFLGTTLACAPSEIHLLQTQPAGPPMDTAFCTNSRSTPCKIGLWTGMSAGGLVLQNEGPRAADPLLSPKKQLVWSRDTVFGDCRMLGHVRETISPNRSHQTTISWLQSLRLRGLRPTADAVWGISGPSNRWFWCFFVMSFSCTAR